MTKTIDAAQAWQMGYDAQSAGETVKACPWKADRYEAALHDQWVNGWHWASKGMQQNGIVRLPCCD